MENSKATEIKTKAISDFTALAAGKAIAAPVIEKYEAWMHEVDARFWLINESNLADPARGIPVLLREVSLWMSEAGYATAALQDFQEGRKR